MELCCSETRAQVALDIGISDMISLLEMGQEDSIFVNSWRWPLLELAADALLVVNDEGRSREQSIWVQEAFLRANLILQLALSSPGQKKFGTRRTCQITQVIRAFRDLRLGHEPDGPDCAGMLHKVISGTASLYSAASIGVDIGFVLAPLQIDPLSRRAFVLLANTAVQAALHGAFRRVGSCKLMLSLQIEENAKYCFTLESSEPLTATFSSPAFIVISGLASILGAEIHWSATATDGNRMTVFFVAAYHNSSGADDHAIRSHRPHIRPLSA